MRDLIRERVLEAFNYRCIFPIILTEDTVLPCLARAEHVHEIMPKSKTKDWNRFENRIPLCPAHHDLVHKFGAAKYEDDLKRSREILLEKWK